MIPLSQITDLSTYAYVGGMRNIVWLVGVIGEISADRKALTLFRKEEGELKQYPMSLQEGDRLPEGAKVGISMKTICHIVTDDSEEGGAGVYLKLKIIGMEQPNLIEMGGGELMQPGDTEQAKATAMETRFGDLTNCGELAGFMHGDPVLDKGKDESGANRKKDRLTILLKQGTRPSNLHRVVVRGKFAAQYKSKLRQNGALFVQGEIASEEQDGVTRLTFVTKQLRVPTLGDQIKAVPEWVANARRREEDELLEEVMAGA